jgi:hypothetical protein
VSSRSCICFVCTRITYCRSFLDGLISLPLGDTPGFGKPNLPFATMTSSSSCTSADFWSYFVLLSDFLCRPWQGALVRCAAALANLAVTLLASLAFFFGQTAFKLNSLWHVGYLRDDLCDFCVCSRLSSVPYDSSRRPDFLKPPQLLGFAPSYVPVIATPLLSSGAPSVFQHCIFFIGTPIQSFDIL